MTKVKVNLYERDYERLKDLYPIQGPARVIRALVRAYINKIEAQTRPSLGDLAVELSEADIA